eukprot:scaffold481_cov238-Pinguiococcus_pyrenoidosus.AAC.7
MAAVRLRLTSTITPEGYGPGHCSSSRSKAIVKSGAPASLGSASTGHSPSLTWRRKGASETSRALVTASEAPFSSPHACCHRHRKAAS